MCLLTCQLVVKAGQADAEGLEWAQGPHEVTCEASLRYLAKLQHDSVRVCISDQLEVLDTGFCDSSLEVEAIGIHGIIPLWGLVPHHCYDVTSVATPACNSAAQNTH